MHLGITQQHLVDMELVYLAVKINVQASCSNPANSPLSGTLLLELEATAIFSGLQSGLHEEGASY